LSLMELIRDNVDTSCYCEDKLGRSGARSANYYAQNLLTEFVDYRTRIC
jgi:hypothetical protein